MGITSEDSQGWSFVTVKNCEHLNVTPIKISATTLAVVLGSSLFTALVVEEKSTKLLCYACWKKALLAGMTVS